MSSALRAWVLVLLGLSFPVAGCSRGDGGGQGTPSGRGRSSGPIPVAVTNVQERDLSRTVTVAGPVEPIRTVSVNAQTSGTVLTVKKEEGDRVAAGELMAELDSREVSAQLGHAKAVLANAESAFQRAKELKASDLASDAQLDVARSTFQIAQADVELWATRLAFCRIAAPVAGVVTVKKVETGSTVSANDSMFEIADDSELVVRVRVSELEVVHLAPGRAVTLRLDAYPNAKLTGHIRRIFPSADAASRLVPVEVVLDGTPPGVDVRPGFLARVEFPLDTRTDVLVVPAAAIGVSDSGSFVYVVDADTLSRRPVVTGLTASGWIEVTHGLQSGEPVVSSGQVNLRPGAQIRVTAGDGAEGSADGGDGGTMSAGTAAAGVGR
jgi:membrane fusion protein, multidrug efflux system